MPLNQCLLTCPTLLTYHSLGHQAERGRHEPVQKAKRLVGWSSRECEYRSSRQCDYPHSSAILLHRCLARARVLQDGMVDVRGDAAAEHRAGARRHSHHHQTGPESQMDYTEPLAGPHHRRLVATRRPSVSRGALRWGGLGPWWKVLQLLFAPPLCCLWCWLVRNGMMTRASGGDAGPAHGPAHRHYLTMCGSRMCGSMPRALPSRALPLPATVPCFASFLSPPLHTHAQDHPPHFVTTPLRLSV